MWIKQVFQAGVLIVFAIVAAGCGAPMITETTAGSVEPPVETTPADAQESLVVGEATLVGESPDSTAVGMITTALSTLEYSPAWIEWQDLQPYNNSDSLERIRIINHYMSSNPNDDSTSMGALCWAFHELSRSFMMGISRWLLDDYFIPDLMEEYGITREQVGNPGPEATEAFLDLVSGGIGSVGSVDVGQAVLPADNGQQEPVGSTGRMDNKIKDEYWESIRLDHEFAGDGTPWSNAVRAVASPEMAAAFRAGDGLPPDVQVYADALVAFARERVGKELDPSAEIDDTEFRQKNFPGLPAFMGAAKYHQDCKRAEIVDIPETVDSSSTSTTREYSPAWIESKDLQQRSYSDDLEDIQYSHEYIMTNPNDISTPMGALCWVYHELSRSVTMGNVRSMLDYYSIPALMEEYGVTSEQVGPPGPEATASFIALVSDRSGLFGSKAVLTEDELAFVRMWHDYAGDGTEWADAIRMVASFEMTAAFRAGDGLPEDVLVYADALQAFARERIGVELDLSAESEDTIYEREGFPGREAFMEAAKYHQDCERALIYDSNGAVDAGGGNG